MNLVNLVRLSVSLRFIFNKTRFFLFYCEHSGFLVSQTNGKCDKYPGRLTGKAYLLAKRQKQGLSDKRNAHKCSEKEKKSTSEKCKEKSERDFLQNMREQERLAPCRKTRQGSAQNRCAKRLNKELKDKSCMTKKFHDQIWKTASAWKRDEEKSQRRQKHQITTEKFQGSLRFHPYSRRAHFAKRVNHCTSSVLGLNVYLHLEEGYFLQDRGGQIASL